MPHHNLYRSLGLNPYGTPGELYQQLSMRLAATPPLDAALVDELQTARAVLGNSARKDLYDRQLQNPHAQPITLDALRQLARMNIGGQSPSHDVPHGASQAERNFRASHSSFAAPGNTRKAPRRGNETSFATKVRDTSEKLRVSARKNPKFAWATGGVATLLVIMIVAVVGVSSFGGPSSSSDGSTPNVDTFANANWDEDNFIKGPNDPPIEEQYLDSGLAKSSLLAIPAAFSTGSSNQRNTLLPMLPNGIYKKQSPGTRQAIIMPMPGQPAYATSFTTEAQDAKFSWTAFSEEDGEPVITKASYIETPGQGLTERRDYFLIEQFDAVTGEDKNRKEFDWVPQDGLTMADFSGFLTHTQGKTVARFNKGLVEFDMSTGSSRAILSTPIILETVPNLKFRHPELREVSFEHGNLIFNNGIPYFATYHIVENENENDHRTLRYQIILTSLRDGTLHAIHEVTALDGWHMLEQVTLHESPAGIAIIDPAGDPVRIWNEESGTSEPIGNQDQFSFDDVSVVGNNLIIMNQRTGLTVLSLEDGTERLFWPTTKLESLSIDDYTADDEFLYLEQSGSWFKVDLETGEEIEDPPLSIPIDNHEGYERRQSPTSDGGWDSGKTGTFVFHS